MNKPTHYSVVSRDHYDAPNVTFKHITGPKLGGLNVDYDQLPYYPIKVREKLQKDEVEPLQRISSDELIRRVTTR